MSTTYRQAFAETIAATITAADAAVRDAHCALVATGDHKPDPTIRSTHAAALRHLVDVCPPRVDLPNGCHALRQLDTPDGVVYSLRAPHGVTIGFAFVWIAAYGLDGVDWMTERESEHA